MRHHKACGAVLLAAALTSCVWRDNTETTQLEARCALHFVGNTASAHASVAGPHNYSFDIEGDGMRYAIEPGTYRVTVTRADQIVVDRRVFVADGETREVRIP